MNQRHAMTNAFLLGGPIFLGLFTMTVSFLARTHAAALALSSLGLYVTGLSLFLKAKFAAIAQGDLFTIGSSGMSPQNRKLYRTGYAIMALASLLSLAIMF